MTTVKIGQNIQTIYKTSNFTQNLVSQSDRQRDKSVREINKQFPDLNSQFLDIDIWNSIEILIEIHILVLTKSSLLKILK